MILVAVGGAALVLSACGGSDDPVMVGPGQPGTGGTVAGTGGGAPAPGTGGGAPAPGTGGGAPAPGPGAGTVDSTFATNGYGENGSWKGYAFTATGDGLGGTITPVDFSDAGAELCASGTTAASYEDIGMIGWNVNQADAEPNPPGTVTPSGSGVTVAVQNNGTSELRVQIQTPGGTQQWCATLPASGTAQIPWGEFTKNCWCPDDPTNPQCADYPVTYANEPIEQVAVLAPAAYSAEVDGPGATPFSFCVVTLGEY